MVRLPFFRHVQHISLQTAREAIFSSPIEPMDRRVALRPGDWIDFKNGSSRIAYFRNTLMHSDAKSTIENLRIETHVAEGVVDATFVDDKLMHISVDTIVDTDVRRPSDLTPELCAEARECIHAVRAAYRTAGGSLE